MGNKKNKKNHRNNHRHVYVKKKLPIPVKKNTSSPLKGSRIMNMANLQKFSNELALHSASCDGSVTLGNEKKFGLASVIRGDCKRCRQSTTLETSTKVKGPRGFMQWENNIAAVWGEMVTGGGHSNLEEIMSILGVPVLTKPCFISIERGIGEFWKQCLTESMMKAGKEEKQLAQEMGNYHEGIPAITVIVDGGWSKRSHKHSYNAKSGVGIIVGRQTGKLLYIGVRNKFCAACSRNIPQDKHICFRNWTKSSSEMESDIILQGFLEAQKVHGVRYTTFIGDGDSSVHITLIQGVPEWGHAIKKLECANHACKCYRNALEKLVQEKTSYKGKGGLTLQMRKKLVSSARCAIKMRSSEPDRRKAIKLLQQDLVNGPRHCFGLHQACSVDYCSVARKAAMETPTLTIDVESPQPLAMNRSSALHTQAPPSASLCPASTSSGSLLPAVTPSTSAALPVASPPLQSTSTQAPSSLTSCPVSITVAAPVSVNDDSAEDNGDVFDLIVANETLWHDTLAEDMENNCPEEQFPAEINPNMFHDIQNALSRLVSKADQLIDNCTTNLAEAWMHIRCKFDGGKVINRSQSGSWEHRCMGAGLQQNLGKKWGAEIWKEMSLSSPNKIFVDFAEQSVLRLKADNRRKAKPEVKALRRRKKKQRVDDSAAALVAYSRPSEGVSPIEVDDDVTPEFLNELKAGFYSTKVKLTSEEARVIERKTVQQADCDEWIPERRKRITASVAGGIGKMRSSSSRSKKTQQLLYSNFKGNIATRYGVQREDAARQQYVLYMKHAGHSSLKVEKCGLFVSVDNPWLAATPDGIVEDSHDEASEPLGLLEIKNPYSIRFLTIPQAIEKSTFCLEKAHDGRYRLKRRHDYHFQVQCQLYCTNRNWCDFVVVTEKDFYVERIRRDSDWWLSIMAKLKDFYFSSVLPELACPRHHKGGIRN